MRQAKRKRDKTAIALILCFAVVALTSVFALKSGLEKIQKKAVENVPISEQTETTPSDTKIPSKSAKKVPAKIPTVDSKDKKNDSHSKKSNPDSHDADFIAPVQGSVLVGYSMDMPVYSKTLDQYMTHRGVDISSSPGTQVKACAQGTVIKVYRGDEYGITVVIKHKNDFTSVYSNLSTTEMVETGDVVQQGQVISGVGDTALFENMEEDHLHFELMKNNKYVDPLDYIMSL